jgi:hypothetical protein
MMTRNQFLATHRVYLKRMARAFSRSERLPARRELVADELFSDVALALLERWDTLTAEQRDLSATEPKFRNRMLRNLFSAALKGRAQDRFERAMVSTAPQAAPALRRRRILRMARLRLRRERS